MTRCSGSNRLFRRWRHRWCYQRGPPWFGRDLRSGKALGRQRGRATRGSKVCRGASRSGRAQGHLHQAIVVQGAGRKQYVQFLSKGIVGVDAKTGQFLWRYKEVVKGPAQAFTPVASDGYIYGGALSVGGGLIRLKPDGSGVVAEQVYFERGLPNGFGGAVLVGDYLYGAAVPGGELVAAEFTTGKLKWKAEGFGRASVTYADGHLYLHNENGDYVLVVATPEGYREKGRFAPPNQPKKKPAGQYAERAFASPVIANGRLYIRDLETLWAYDIKASR